MRVQIAVQHQIKRRESPMFLHRGRSHALDAAMHHNERRGAPSVPRPGVIVCSFWPKVRILHGLLTICVYSLHFHHAYAQLQPGGRDLEFFTSVVNVAYRSSFLSGVGVRVCAWWNQLSTVAQVVTPP